MQAVRHTEAIMMMTVWAFVLAAMFLVGLRIYSSRPTEGGD
jgi:hypothetical protein